LQNKTTPTPLICHSDPFDLHTNTLQNQTTPTPLICL
jgi:hypothetical protein